MKRISLRMAVVILALAVCLAPVAQAAEKADETSLSADLGLGVASFLCTLPYGAIKVATGLLGSVVGGFTYVLSGLDMRAADAVWYTTIEATTWLPPITFAGKRTSALRASRRREPPTRASLEAEPSPAPCGSLSSGSRRISTLGPARAGARARPRSSSGTAT